MEKLFALVGLFRKGNEVADPEKWKTGQITANYLAGALIAAFAAAKAFGFELPITDEVAYSIAGGILAAVNLGLTAITSKKAGLLPAKPEQPPEQPPTTPEQPGYDQPSPGHPYGP